VRPASGRRRSVAFEILHLRPERALECRPRLTPFLVRKQIAILLDDWLLSRDSQHRSHQQICSGEAVFKMLAVAKQGREIVKPLIDECFENRAALSRPIFIRPQEIKQTEFLQRRLDGIQCSKTPGDGACPLPFISRQQGFAAFANMQNNRT
jgi:hypothetical protein